MDDMNLARLEVKNVYQCLFVELKEDYGLSQIEAKALRKRLEQFLQIMRQLQILFFLTVFIIIILFVMIY